MYFHFLACWIEFHHLLGTVVCDDFKFIYKSALNSSRDEEIVFLGVKEMVDLTECDVLILHKHQLV